jgi:hypothetical protein
VDDEPETVGQTLERVVGEAIQGAVAQHETGFVTKWVAIVESVDPAGARGLWTMTSDDVTAWDTVGLLQHGLHLQQAQTLTDRFGPDGDA